MAGAFLSLKFEPGRTTSAKNAKKFFFEFSFFVAHPTKKQKLTFVLLQRLLLPSMSHSSLDSWASLSFCLAWTAFGKDVR